MKNLFDHETDINFIKAIFRTNTTIWWHLQPIKVTNLQWCFRTS